MWKCENNKLGRRSEKKKNISSLGESNELVKFLPVQTNEE